MRLSREKIVRMSHLIVERVAGFDSVEFVEDRNTVRLEIVKILQDLLRELRERSEIFPAESVFKEAFDGAPAHASVGELGVRP